VSGRGKRKWEVITRRGGEGKGSERCGGEHAAPALNMGGMKADYHDMFLLSTCTKDVLVSEEGKGGNGGGSLTAKETRLPKESVALLAGGEAAGAQRSRIG
jgi:hypothetical protein